MRSLSMIAAVCLALASPPAPAADIYLETITSTGTSTSSTALAGGQQFALQCDAAARYRACERATCTATTNDMRLAANEVMDVVLKTGWTRIAVIRESGTANCRLYSVNPRTLPE